MRKFKFGKLVHDNIVDAIIKSGNKPIWHKLNDEDYVLELKKKVIEEAEELNSEEGEALVKELADIAEIVDNLLSVLGVSRTEFEKIKQKKSKSDGSFKNKHYIDYVEVKDDASEIEYYLKYPEKYPEILEED